MFERGAHVLDDVFDEVSGIVGRRFGLEPVAELGNVADGDIVPRYLYKSTP